MRSYKFKKGDKVRIRASRDPTILNSVGVVEHDGEIVTIKERSKHIIRTYYLEEIDHLWDENCLEKI